MANLVPFPLFRAFDANGAPLVGGLLYAYVAGTSVAKATYSDASEVSPNPNPVVLDANGAADVWLQGGGAYKLVLKDANGVTQWSIDNVSVGSDGSVSSTSSTPLTVDPGTAILTTQARKPWTRGMFINVASNTAHSAYMHGRVLDYDTLAGTLTIDVTLANGTGLTASDWVLTMAGPQATETALLSYLQQGEAAADRASAAAASALAHAETCTASITTNLAILGSAAAWAQTARAHADTCTAAITTVLDVLGSAVAAEARAKSAADRATAMEASALTWMNCANAAAETANFWALVAQNAAASATAAVAGGSVKISSADQTLGALGVKLESGVGITIETANPGSAESLIISLDTATTAALAQVGMIQANSAGSFQYLSAVLHSGGGIDVFFNSAGAILSASVARIPGNPVLISQTVATGGSNIIEMSMPTGTYDWFQIHGDLSIPIASMQLGTAETAYITASAYYHRGSTVESAVYIGAGITQNPPGSFYEITIYPNNAPVQPSSRPVIAATAFHYPPLANTNFSGFGVSTSQAIVNTTGQLKCCRIIGNDPFMGTVEMWGFSI